MENKELVESYLQSVLKSYLKKLKIYTEQLSKDKINVVLTKNYLDELNITKNIYKELGLLDECISDNIKYVDEKLTEYQSSDKKYTSFLKKEREKLVYNLMIETEIFGKISSKSDLEFKKDILNHLNKNYKELFKNLGVTLDDTLYNQLMTYIETSYSKFKLSILDKKYLIYMEIKKDTKKFIINYLESKNSNKVASEITENDKYLVEEYILDYFKVNVPTRFNDSDKKALIKEIANSFLIEHKKMYKENIDLNKELKITFNMKLKSAIDKEIIKKLALYLNRDIEVLNKEIERNTKIKEDKLVKQIENVKSSQESNLDVLDSLFKDIYNVKFKNWFENNLIADLKRAKIIQEDIVKVSPKINKRQILNWTGNYITTHKIHDIADIKEILFKFSIQAKIIELKNKIDEDKNYLHYHLNKEDFKIILRVLNETLIEVGNTISKEVYLNIANNLGDLLASFTPFKYITIYGYEVKDHLLVIDNLSLQGHLDENSVKTYIRQTIDNFRNENNRKTNYITRNVDILSIFHTKYKKFKDKDVIIANKLNNSLTKSVKIKRELYCKKEINTLNSEVEAYVVNDEFTYGISKAIDELLTKYQNLGYTFNKSFFVSENIQQIRDFESFSGTDESLSDNIENIFLPKYLKPTTLTQQDMLSIQKVYNSEINKLGLKKASKEFNEFINTHKETLYKYKEINSLENKTEFSLSLNLAIREFLKRVYVKEKESKIAEQKTRGINTAQKQMVQLPEDKKRLLRLKRLLEENTKTKKKSLEVLVVEKNNTQVGVINAPNILIEFTPNNILCYYKKDKRNKLPTEIKKKANETVLQFWSGKGISFIKSTLNYGHSIEWALFVDSLRNAFDLRKTI